MVFVFTNEDFRNFLETHKNENVQFIWKKQEKEGVVSKKDFSFLLNKLVKYVIKTASDGLHAPKVDTIMMVADAVAHVFPKNTTKDNLIKIGSRSRPTGVLYFRLHNFKQKQANGTASTTVEPEKVADASASVQTKKIKTEEAPPTLEQIAADIEFLQHARANQLSEIQLALQRTAEVRMQKMKSENFYDRESVIMPCFFLPISTSHSFRVQLTIS